jgi:hypothetical protein
MILSVSAMSLLAMTVGCVHTAGVCDCNGNGNGNGGALHPVANGTKPEPIKEMPKETPKEKVEADTPEPPPAQ